MLDIQEDIKLGATLNDNTGLPPNVFTNAHKEYFRGLFKIILRYAFKGPELAKIKALIVSMSIDYFFVMEIKGVYSIMITSMILLIIKLV